MIDYAPDTRDPAALATSHECLLIWLMLTLLNAQSAPPDAPPQPVIDARAATVALPHGGLLTPREIEVLRLVTLGLTNAQIAAHLFLSRRTVDQHLVSIYNRLGVSCRAAATRLAMLNDLCA